MDLGRSWPSSPTGLLTPHISACWRRCKWSRVGPEPQLGACLFREERRSLRKSARPPLRVLKRFIGGRFGPARIFEPPGFLANVVFVDLVIVARVFDQFDG